MSKKVTFDAKRPSRSQPGNVDDWVQGREPMSREPMKRLTIDIALSLHARVKTGCAVEKLVIAEVVRDFLEGRFPLPKDAASHGLNGTAGPS